MLSSRITRVREEVVEVEDDVRAGVLGPERRITDLVQVGVLLVDLDGNPDG